MILSLLVNGRELAAALKTLRKFTKRSQDPQLVFTFDDNLLTIAAPGIKLKAMGLGSLKGQAYVYWHSLRGVAAVPPSDEEVMMKVEAGRLIIGSSSLPCTWQESILELIEMSMDAPLLDMLRLRMKYNDEQIARSGLTEAVWESERRMNELIVQASRLLAPLGVDRKTVARIVEESVQQISRETQDD
jgi:hypothetical protein